MCACVVLLDRARGFRGIVKRGKKGWWRGSSTTWPKGSTGFVARIEYNHSVVCLWADFVHGTDGSGRTLAAVQIWFLLSFLFDGSRIRRSASLILAKERFHHRHRNSRFHQRGPGDVATCGIGVVVMESKLRSNTTIVIRK